MTLLVRVLVLALPVVFAFADKEERFLAWARQHGAVFDTYIEWPFEFENSGRGARAVRQIEPNTVFLSLPAELVLNAKNARKVAKERGLDSDVFYTNDLLWTNRLRSFDRMILIMMYERVIGNASFWAPYLDVLPEKNVDALTEWTEAELAELQNDAILEAREVYMQERFACLETIFRLLFLVEREWRGLTNRLANETLFEWAFFVISSRSFQLLDDEDEFNMIPVADLLNHHSMSSVAWKLNDNNNRFEMRLMGTKSIEKDLEVFNHYGDLTSDRTLLDYSFLLDENYLEQVTVEMPLDMDDLELKRDVWDGSEVDLDHFTNIRHLMQFCRIVSSTSSSLRDELHLNKPFPTLQQEQRAFQVCRDIILKQVPGTTTLDEDRAELDRTPVNNVRKRQALKYRLIRKRLFHRYAEFCTVAIEKLIQCSVYKRLINKPLNAYWRKLDALSRLELAKFE